MISVILAQPPSVQVPERETQQNLLKQMYLKDFYIRYLLPDREEHAQIHEKAFTLHQKS